MFYYLLHILVAEIEALLKRSYLVYFEQTIVEILSSEVKSERRSFWS